MKTSTCLFMLSLSASLLFTTADSGAREVVAGGRAHHFVPARPDYHRHPHYCYGYGYSGYWPGWGSNNVNVNNADASNGNSLPQGALLTLPSGAAPVTVFGKTYFFANGNYYSPQPYRGKVIYVPANP